MRRALLVSAALTITLAIAAPSGAAVKSAVDRHGGIRLTLNGRVLTADIIHPKARDNVFGKPIDAACSRRFDPSLRELVHTALRWPEGTSRVRFRFRRDISRRAKWCLIEHRGADVAVGWFVKREKPRFVGKGRAPSGQWWRLAGWRGLREEPCALLRLADLTNPVCFNEMVDGRTTLGVREFSCDSDVFVFGIAGAEWSSVSALLTDGTVVETKLFDPPSGSRVRGQYFMAGLPQGTDARAVEAVEPGVASLRRPLPGKPVCGPS